MIDSVSPNTQSILLLTAPLVIGRGAASERPLTTAEYNRVAQRLREARREPADLLVPEKMEELQDLFSEIDIGRLRILLGRGFQLSQAVERWRSRAIWVTSRADTLYPRRFKNRLKDHAPPVLYGCGDASIAETGGLAVVGSRDVDDVLLEYAQSVGRLAAEARRTVISGGARGVDQAAMRGALRDGGRAIGVLADSLEKAVLAREERDHMVNGRLLLLSPYDPSMGFHVGNAMQRNKLIYALADAALVVNSDLEKGGTWTGAIEQLDRFRFLSVYVRSTGHPVRGLEGLQKRGALPWPNPSDPAELEAVLARPAPPPDAPAQSSLPFSSPVEPAVRPKMRAGEPASPYVAYLDTSIFAAELFRAVRDAVVQILTRPMTATEVAAALDVTADQASNWLERLTDEGAVERIGRPAMYSPRAALR